MAAKAKERKTRESIDEMLKAISHEARIDILRICSEQVTSPNEFAQETGRSLSQISYHFKSLWEEGVLTLVRTEPRRGAVEHYYRANVPAMFDDEAWAKMPEKSRRVVYRTILQALFAESAAAEAEGAFNADDAHLSWVSFHTDGQGRTELNDALAEFLERTEQIKKGSADRLTKSDGDGQSEEVVVATMGFNRAPRPSAR